MRMKTFDENSASAQELRDYCLCEYNSRNIISRKMIENFYKTLGYIIKRINNDESVLEVGCGAGESTRRIRELIKCELFDASDYDERYITILKSMNLKCNLSVESVYCLNRKDNEYDHVIMLEVLEHLENTEKAIEELFRVASKSVIISVPNEPIWSILNMLRFKYLKEYGNTPGHINRYSKKSLVKLLSKYGKVKNIYSPLPWIIVECQKR